MLCACWHGNAAIACMHAQPVILHAAPSGLPILLKHLSVAPASSLCPCFMCRQPNVLGGTASFMPQRLTRDTLTMGATKTASSEQEHTIGGWVPGCVYFLTGVGAQPQARVRARAGLSCIQCSLNLGASRPRHTATHSPLLVPYPPTAQAARGSSRAGERGEVDDATVEEAAYYCRYAFAAYGWMLSIYRSPG